MSISEVIQRINLVRNLAKFDMPTSLIKLCLCHMLNQKPTLNILYLAKNFFWYFNLTEVRLREGSVGIDTIQQGSPTFWILGPQSLYTTFTRTRCWPHRAQFLVLFSLGAARGKISIDILKQVQNLLTKHHRLVKASYYF